MKKSIPYIIIAFLTLVLILSCLLECSRKTVTIDHKEYKPIGMHHGIVQHDTIVSYREKLVHSKPILVHHYEYIDTTEKGANSESSTYTDTIQDGGLTVIVNDSLHDGAIVARQSLITRKDTIFKESRTDTLIVEKRRKLGLLCAGCFSAGFVLGALK